MKAQALRLLLLMVLGAIGAAGHAQNLLDTTLTLGKKPDPVVLEFTPTAGDYRITVTDLGSALGPVRLGRVDAAVLRGSELLTSVNLTNAGPNAGTKPFTATAVKHRLVLIGQPASPARVGSVGVRIEDAVSGAALVDTVKVFTVPPPVVASPADFEDEFAVGAGTYTLEVTDFALPQASTLDVVVVPKSNPTQTTAVTPGVPVQLTAGASETFQVFTHAELAAGAPRGLVGVNLRITATDATVPGSKTHELGDWPYRYDFNVSSTASLTATLNDLGFPFALTGLAAEIVRDGRRATAKLTAPATSGFAAAAGSYTAYVNAVPAATGPGSFGLRIGAATPATPLVDDAQDVATPGPATDVGTVKMSFDVVTPGDYKLTLTDFGASGFFDAFTSISLAVTRDTQIVQTLNGPGNITFATTPGHYTVAILADPAGTDGEGLLGVRVASVATNAIVLDRTAAVGTDFMTATVDVTTAQSVDVRLVDVGFPGPFSSVKVAVTRGAERVGEIIGAGTFTFAATPGTYVVNMLATANTTAGYSTLGLTASVTPPAPGVVLGSSTSSVASGGSATLTWSATDATSCTASGGWSGARASTGTETVGPLNADTAYTLTCVGPGGSKAATVTIAISATQRSSGGGGGAVDGWLLGLLGAAALIGRRRWRDATLGS